MNNLNSLIIEGNLVKDSVLTEPAPGFKKCYFTIGVNRFYKNRNNQDVNEASFFDVEAYGNMAEYCSEKAKKVKEKLYQAMQEAGIKKWETPNGTKITLVEGGEDELVKVFNEDKFKEEQPVIYASYTEEKLKKGKSGYIKITVAKDDK